MGNIGSLRWYRGAAIVSGPFSEKRRLTGSSESSAIHSAPIIRRPGSTPGSEQVADHLQREAVRRLEAVALLMLSIQEANGRR